MRATWTINEGVSPQGISQISDIFAQSLYSFMRDLRDCTLRERAHSVIKLFQNVAI